MADPNPRELAALLRSGLLWRKPRLPRETREQIAAALEKGADAIDALEKLQRDFIVTGATLHHTMRHGGEPRLCERFACERWTAVAKGLYGDQPNPLYAEWPALGSNQCGIVYQTRLNRLGYGQAGHGK